MFSVRLYIRILLFVSLIVLVLGLGLVGILSGRAIILGSVAILIAVGLMGELVYYLNSCNRKIKIFFDSIEDNESMLYFPETGSQEQRVLHSSFNRICALITEHKKNEFERKLRQKEYEAWEKLMRVLTHEIMNSITPVVSLSETLLSYFQIHGNVPKRANDITDLTIEKTIRGLGTIKSQGQNLIYFTESYRQFSGLKRPVCSYFSLSDVIRNVQILFQDDLRRQHIDFSVDFFRPEIPVYADEKMLSQVLINLLKNAIQAFTEQTDKRIRIGVCRKETTLFIKVTDNGPGIPSNLMEDIFIPFFTTKRNGTGIGLSLSRQIVRMHGGELSVTSQPYRETTFTVSLPLGDRKDVFPSL